MYVFFKFTISDLKLTFHKISISRTKSSKKLSFKRNSFEFSETANASIAVFNNHMSRGDFVHWSDFTCGRSKSSVVEHKKYMIATYRGEKYSYRGEIYFVSRYILW